MYQWLSISCKSSVGVMKILVVLRQEVLSQESLLLISVKVNFYDILAVEFMHFMSVGYLMQ